MFDKGRKFELQFAAGMLLIFYILPLLIILMPGSSTIGSAIVDKMNLLINFLVNP